MKTVKWVFLPLAVALFSLSCEQPFRAGLGAVEDIRRPTVGLTAPGAGDYVWGKEMFTGFAEDDYKIDRVELMITNHPSVNYYKTYQAVPLEKTVQNKGTWSIILDTTLFPDDDLKIRLRAFDSIGKSIETDEILFTIKNQLPAITLTDPYIARGKEPGNIGGANLNYGTLRDLPPSNSFPRSKDRKSLISGTISYEEGIYTGARETDRNGNVRYPPQIRFWPIDATTQAPEGWAPIDVPTEAEIPWVDFILNETLFELGVGRYQFMYELPDVSGRFYGFEVRAQSKTVREDGIVKFHYPRDSWPNWLGHPSWDDPIHSTMNLDEQRFFYENRYVLLFVRTPREFPEVELIKLEDIFGPYDKPDPLNPGKFTYHDLTENGVTLNDNMSHPYVNRLTVNKSGPFTLRVKGSHSEGVLSAEAYWEKADGTKGRFIWDPADTPRNRYGNPITVPGWQQSYNVDPSYPFNQWGFREPNLPAGGNPARNFIFTYRHDGTDIIPNTSSYHEMVRGRRKVQQYMGDDWEGRNKDGWLSINTPDHWRDMITLEDGVYNVEVYARSASGTISSSPHTNTIRLDTVEPSAEIVAIDGAYKTFNLDGLDVGDPYAIVNGVVQPRLRFSDSRPEDSGLRSATDTYNSYLVNPGDDPDDPESPRVYGFEQRYLLVKADVNAMKGVFATGGGQKRYWPPTDITIPTTGAAETRYDSTAIPGVEIWRHGPIFQSRFMFKSSKLYDAPTVEGELPDGDYWLYIFVRDNAFNVGQTVPLLVQVRKDTDKPGIEFLGAIDDGVTDPSPGADGDTKIIVGSNPQETEKGFIAASGETRNSFGPSSTLRLRLHDDDSLDLGMDGADASKVAVTFSAAIDTNGVITARGDGTASYLITLAPNEIKDIFRPQSSDGSGGRQAVRTRDGAISQNLLLEKLKGNNNYNYLFDPKGGKDAYNSLPDGIYRISVTIDDYPPAKLRLDTDTNTPEVAQATIHVWIVVDTTDPEITFGASVPATDTYITPVSLGDGTTGINLVGTISDRNGPVKVTRFDITGDKPETWGGKVSTDTIPQIIFTRTSATDQWIANLTSAKVHIDSSVSDVFNITLGVEDRFGRSSAKVLRYMIDNLPPDVGLRKEIETFERRDAVRLGAASIAGHMDNGVFVYDDPKFTRLTNGIVSFNISASDNIKVTTVRWWLLKKGVAAPSWTTAAPATAQGRYGELTQNFTATQYIDTTTLDDNTEYCLYVIARDGTPTLMSPSTVLQEIYVVKKEDGPYITRNNLSGVVGAGDVTARITITDDDGFAVPSGGSLVARPGSVRIAMSNAAASGYTDFITIGGTSGPGTVTLLGNKIVSVVVDLSAIPTFTAPGAPLATGSGTKYYIVEATDSWNGKFANTSGTLVTESTAGTPTDAETVSTLSHLKYWRHYYNFELDSEPPKIEITAPELGKTFGKLSGTPPNEVTANSFAVTGWISDLHLNKDEDDNYYIGVRVDTGASKTIKLGTGNNSGLIGAGGVVTDANGTKVTFTIPAAIFLSEIDYASLGNGKHTVTFTAEDKSGQTGTFSFNFIKDTEVPIFTFTRGFNDNKTPLPQIAGISWWSANTNPAHYQEKWEKSRTLPVISHDGSSAPSISGTFTDVLSDINKLTFSIKWDGVSTVIPLANTLTPPQLEGDGKFVRWTVYLTTNGQPSSTLSNFLTDGVHSIQLSIKDDAGNELDDADVMYGFRIVSSMPESAITTVNGVAITSPTVQKVFGNGTSSSTTEEVFTIIGTGTSTNLSDVRVRIRYTDTITPVPTPYERSVLGTDTYVTNNTWAFTTSGSVPRLLVTENLTWTLKIPRDYILRAAGRTSGNLLAGNYEIAVIARDNANKNSEENTGNIWSFVIDSTSPTFTFSNLQNVQASEDNRAPDYWIANSSRRHVITSSVRGRVSDENYLADVQYQLSRWTYASDTAGWQIYNGTNWTGDANSSWLSLLSPATTPALTDYPLELDMSAFDDGYYRIQLRARDTSKTSRSGATGWATGNDGNPATSSSAFFFLDRTPPILENVNVEQTHFSSRNVTNNQLSFTVKATDDNRFNNIGVAVQRVNTTGGTLPTANPITAAMRSGPIEKTATFNLAFATTLPDGSYRLVFTATDLAGREATTSRTITLDNQAPTGVIEEPRWIGNVTRHNTDGTPVANNPVDHYFASDTIIGGDAFTIKGTTDDSSTNGSASGPKEIWYRIGYGTQTALPANTQADITTWAKQDVLGSAADRGSLDNAQFDTASKKTTNSLWFKYTPTDTTYDVPAGFADITTADVYSWALNAKGDTADPVNSVAKKYAIGSLSMRGTTYTNGISGTRYLARQVTNQNRLPLNLRRGGGLYSLPIVLRIVDNAGNVFYVLRDIWLYPNGDIPSSVFLNPSEDSTKDSPLGGQISIEGVANDNNSIRTVIYRVKVGNTETYGPAPTADSSIVTNIPNAIKWDAAYDGYANMSNAAVWKSTITQNKNGWYVANLESNSFAPTMPWSFMLNSNNEIASRISTDGFASTNGGSRDLIHVWVEVFVFDGVAPTALSAYSNISLGDDNDINIPKPYVRQFFFTASAPTITARQISAQGSTTPSIGYGQDASPVVSPVAANYVRGGNFALRATLNSGSTSRNIGQVSVRLRGETNSDWRPVFVSGATTTLPNGVGLTWPTANRVATLTYTFNSTATTSTTAQQSIRNGTWTSTGGTFTVDVRVRDTASPPAEAVYTFEVGIDNFAPVADHSTNARTITPKKVAGTNVSFLGRVFDYQGLTSSPAPEFRKVQEVRAWFTRGTGNNLRYINMNTGAATATTITGTSASLPTTTTTIGWTTSYDSVTQVTKGATTYTTVTVPNDAAVTSGLAKVISEGTALPGSGITWSPSTADADIYWSFVQNTINFPDGWMKMHYVVTDHAGNRSYYTQDMIVMNKYPQITDITLYTNNTGNGAVFTTHTGNEAFSEYPIPDTPYASGYLDSGFISKNKVIGFGVNTVSGNAPLHYQARHVRRYEVPLNPDNLLVMAKRAAGTSAATDYLQYYNDSGNLITGTNTDAQGRLSVNSFVNLYTIVPNMSRNLSAEQWRILGVSVVTPVDGSHFVFQAKPGGGAEDDVTKMDFRTVRVYAYQEIVGTRYSPNGSANQPHDVVKPDSLNFSGTAFANIPEAKAIGSGATANIKNAVNDVNGRAYFLVKVWDSVDPNQNINTPASYNENDMLYDAIVIGMKVYPGDTLQPYARLYDLNPYTENAVVGNNLNEAVRTKTLNDAAAPTAVGANVLRGGLYNVGTERAPIKSGYIDPRDSSTALKPYVNKPNDPNLVNPYTGSELGQANGYVSSPADAVGTGTATRDKVSGSILLRGLAWDDQLISNIKLTIGGTTTTILQLTDNADGSKTMKPPANVKAWVYEEISWKTGHTVEWAYLWNTEGSNRGGPQSNVAVSVSVQDYNGGATAGNGLSSAAVTTTAANPPASFHNAVNVDIVPYVTGLERESPRYSTTRSRQGWYSFFQGEGSETAETGIRVLGYNLSATQANVTVSLESATATGTGTALTRKTYGATTRPADTVYPNDGHRFQIGTTSTSGKIIVSVTRDSVTETAWNHSSSHANKSWNREYNAYTDGSDLWTNKTYAHIWQTVGTVDAPGTPRRLFAGSGGVETPGMTLQYVGTNAGRLHGAWADSGEDSVFYADSSAAARTRIVKAGEPYSSTDINFWNGTGTIPATNRAITDYASVVMSRQADGNPLIRMKTQITEGTDHRGSGDETTYIIGPQLGTAPTATNRWQNIRLSKAAASTAEANPGRVFVTAYDAPFQRLFFTVRNNVTMTRGTNTGGTTDTTNNAAAYYLDGTNANGLTAPNNGTAASLVTGNATGSIAAAAIAGEYSAIDYDSYGRPVIAYYDQSNETLRLLYANSNNPTTAAAWTRRYVLTSTDPLYRGSGTYVSMKIQRTREDGTEAQGNADIIHLAFFNNVQNTLVYARGTRGGTFTTYTVDTVVKGGMYTDISLDSTNNPWIVYADSTRIGSNGGARIAYRDATTFTRTTLDPLYRSTDTNSAGWEALTMPAYYTVNRDRLNIEAWPPQVPTSVTAPTATAVDWNAAVGYGSDFFRLSYFKKPTAALLSNPGSGIWWQEQ